MSEKSFCLCISECTKRFQKSHLKLQTIGICSFQMKAFEYSRLRYDYSCILSLRDSGKNIYKELFSKERCAEKGTCFCFLAFPVNKTRNSRTKFGRLKTTKPQRRHCTSSAADHKHTGHKLSKTIDKNFGPAITFESHREPQLPASHEKAKSGEGACVNGSGVREER